MIYVFKSKYTGKEVKIPILEDDIIINNELRRIIRDETGQIPYWAKPARKVHDYMRITPDGKCYGKSGKLLNTTFKKRNIEYYSLNYNLNNGNRITYSISKLIAYAYINVDYSKVENILYHGRAKYNDVTNIDIIYKGESLDERYVASSAWKHMIERCYNYEKNIRNKSYADCEVCREWLDKEVYRLWDDANRYKIKSGSTLELDKDILVKGNRLYSPERCLLVPKYINSYFNSLRIERKYNLPVGVSLIDGKYVAKATINMEGKAKYLGYYDTPSEAHEAWVNFKNEQLGSVIIPYFINDITSDDRNHPMFIKVLKTLTKYRFI